MQDLCGVGDYNPDKQDTYWNDDPVELSVAISGLSWGASYEAAVVDACGERNIIRVCWVVCQFDFRYEPADVKRKPTGDAVFLGVFPYRVRRAHANLEQRGSHEQRGRSQNPSAGRLVKKSEPTNKCWRLCKYSTTTVAHNLMPSEC